MARGSVVQQTVQRQKYYWPDGQLNFWTIVTLAAGCTILGVFASFMQINERLGLKNRTPWIFPYGITVGALTVVGIIIQLALIAQRRLLPSYMLLLSIILFVLYLAGVIGTAIQVFGQGGVNTYCQNYVTNRKPTENSLGTLAWLESNDICSCWYAVFSFWIIGDVFFIWMMIMASQVLQDAFI